MVAWGRSVAQDGAEARSNGPHPDRDRRDLAATLVTRDRAIIPYGEQGNVSVLAC
jgi:hypothetical protein